MPIAAVLQRFVDDEFSRAPTLIVRVAAGGRPRLFLHGRWARVQLLWRSD